MSLTRKDLDNRTLAAKNFDLIARGVTEDLGGPDVLSTVQQVLVEAFSGVAVLVHDANVRILKGEKVDILVHATAVSTLCRTASRIGLHRISREIESLSGYLKRATTLDDAADIANVVEHAAGDGG